MFAFLIKSQTPTNERLKWKRKNKKQALDKALSTNSLTVRRFIEHRMSKILLFFALVRTGNSGFHLGIPAQDTARGHATQLQPIFPALPLETVSQINDLIFTPSGRDWWFYFALPLLLDFMQIFYSISIGTGTAWCLERSGTSFRFPFRLLEEIDEKLVHRLVLFRVPFLFCSPSY